MHDGLGLSIQTPRREWARGRKTPEYMAKKRKEWEAMRKKEMAKAPAGTWRTVKVCPPKYKDPNTGEMTQGPCAISQEFLPISGTIAPSRPQAPGEKRRTQFMGIGLAAVVAYFLLMRRRY
jgi:hypothetical protein